MNEILVRGGRLFQICRKDESGDIAGLQEYVVTEKVADDAHKSLIVGERVKRFQALDHVVDRRKLRFSRYMRRMAGDRLIGVVPVINPSDLAQDRNDVSSGLKDGILVYEVSDKEIAVTVGLLAQGPAVFSDVG